MKAIYKLTSPSGKVYIGQSINIKSRLSAYKNGHCKTQTGIYNAIEKYGWNNMQVEILWSTKDDTNVLHILNEFESDFIKLYDCISPNGYNLKGGGDSFTMSDETKLKMTNSRIGKITSDETKEKLRQINLGKKMSAESNRKLSVAKSIPIIQLDKQGNFIKEWTSSKEACDELGLDTGNIAKVLKGKNITCGGYKWIKKI